jgi:hypothetical protein
MEDGAAMGGARTRVRASAAAAARAEAFLQAQAEVERLTDLRARLETMTARYSGGKGARPGAGTTPGGSLAARAAALTPGSAVRPLAAGLLSPVPASAASPGGAVAFDVLSSPRPPALASPLGVGVRGASSSTAAATTAATTAMKEEREGEVAGKADIATRETAAAPAAPVAGTEVAAAPAAVEEEGAAPPSSLVPHPSPLDDAHTLSLHAVVHPEIEGAEGINAGPAAAAVPEPHRQLDVTAAAAPAPTDV